MSAPTAPLEVPLPPPSHPRAADLPTVAVVLPIRNEAAHIDACLERLLQQDYPRDLLEILVVDGRSEDATREVVQRVQARHPDARVRLLDNPGRIVPSALNIGIRAARGEVVVRMDGHAVPAADYVSKCVAAIARTGAANVGGVVEPVGGTTVGAAVALATQHPLGAGDARYRIGGEAGDVDTVAFGAFRRDVFDRIGLFDESMERDQDYELNVRIRKAGERIYLDPAIGFTYRPRGTVRGLWTQYFQYGWWKGETWRRHLTSFRWRQLLPPTFVAGLVVLGFAAPWWPLAAFGLAAAVAVYLAAIGVVATRIARPPASAAAVALAFVVMHFAYGSGVLLWAVTLGRFPYRARPPSVPRLGDLPLDSITEVTP